MTSSPLTRVALKVIGIKYPQQHYCLLRVYSIREVMRINIKRLSLIVRVITRTIKLNLLIFILITSLIE